MTELRIRTNPNPKSTPNFVISENAASEEAMDEISDDTSEDAKEVFDCKNKIST